MKLAHGTDLAEAHAAGSPWKSRQVLKITNKPDQMERKGSFLGDSQRFSQQSENSVSFTSNLEKKIKPTTPVEKTYIKTVRATMFDHHVQRHHIAAEHPGTDSALKTSNGLEGKSDVVTWGHSRRSWMAEVEEIASIKKEYPKQSDSSKYIAEGEKNGKPACSSEDKKMTLGILLEKSLVEKSEKPTPKTTEDLVLPQRVEPRYEIFQTCGERALSEAIAMAPEKKAMTLRTRKSSAKETRSDGDVLHPGQSTVANSKPFCLKEDNVTSEAGDPKVFTSQSALREARDFFSSECTLPEQRKDSNKSETGPVLIAEKIPYSTNKSKCLGVSEQVNKLHSETKTNQSEASSVDKAERSPVAKCSSEQRSFRPGGTEPYELRTSFDREVTLPSAVKHGAQSSSVLPSGQVCKSTISCHPDRKAPTTNKEEAVGLRKSLDSNGKEQVCGLDSAAPENSRTVRVIDPEEKVRRTRSSVSDLKISERWRRRTLPQDFIKTEEVVWLPPENIRRLSRTESLQLDEGSVKKRSKKSTEGLEGNEANRAVLGSADNYLKSQSSAFEPKATYFAVTYQAPGNSKEKSCVSAPSAGETKTIPSSSEGVTINLDPVSPGRSKPLLQQPHKNAMSTSHREDSWQVHISKDWVKEDNKDDVFSKTIPFGNFNVSRKDNQQYHEKSQDRSKEKFVDVDAFLLKQDLGSTAQTDLKSSRRKVSSYHDPRSPPCVAQLHEDSEVVLQKKSGNTYDVSGRKAEGGYRSQILDIDALMAEYKEESVKAGGVQGRLAEDLSSFSTEKWKNKRNMAERTTSSYSWKEWKGTDHCSPNAKPGDRAEECHRPEKSILSEKSKEKPQSGSPEFDKQMSKDRKFSPPYWGSPSSLLSDKFVSSPTEFSRKKTFIIDEDEEVSLTSRNQSSKFVIDKVQPISAIGTDRRWEVNFASKLSLKADDGLLQKKLVTKEQFVEVSAEGDWSKNVARSSITRSKDNANKVTCENDSANAKSKLDWKSYSSGLGSAPAELRRSYSEKIRQGKDNLPLMHEVRGRKDLYLARQSCPVESSDSGWKLKLSSQSEFFFHEDKKVLPGGTHVFAVTKTKKRGPSLGLCNSSPWLCSREQVLTSQVLTALSPLQFTCEAPGLIPALKWE